MFETIPIVNPSVGSELTWYNFEESAKMSGDCDWSNVMSEKPGFVFTVKNIWLAASIKPK